MSAAVLSDFGSTVCKVTVVDLDDAVVLGHGEAPTFLGDDVMDGYDAAYDLAIAGLTRRLDVTLRLSSSSAGGGLRMAAVGLVAEMTAAAAHRAALNAGARLELVLHGRLDERATQELDRVDPEIVLFSGGTDGGQRDMVLSNAKFLAAGSWSAQVVVACNKEVRHAVAEIFRRSGRSVYLVDNVMPRIGQADPNGSRATILDIFLKHVIRGKNLSDRREFLDSMVTATPEAVLAATRLLAFGTDDSPGANGVVVVDVGGATTDVHSVSTAPPAIQGRRVPLLPLPSELRTVNGDLGMRVGSRGAVEADYVWLADQSGLSRQHWAGEADRRTANPAWLATEATDQRNEELLGTSCVTHALARHCGRQGWIYGKDADPTLMISGPDLRNVPVVVGTGGVIVHHENPPAVLDPALSRASELTMSPESAQVVVDHGYVLAAAGLLNAADPNIAMRILTRAIELDLKSMATSQERTVSA